MIVGLRDGGRGPICGTNETGVISGGLMLVRLGDAPVGSRCWSR